MRQKSPNKAIYQQLNEVEIDYSHHPKKQIHQFITKVIILMGKYMRRFKKNSFVYIYVEIIDKNYDEEIPDSDT